MKKVFVVCSLLVAAVMLLTACGPAATPVEVWPPTMPPAPPTAVPPTPNPLGTAAMPIIVAFEPSGTSQEITAGGQELLSALALETGLVFKGVVPTSYAALTEAMGSGNAQIGWMATFAYLIAHEKGYAEAALITIRFGSDHYGSQFLANVSSGFTAAADKPGTEAELATTLAQFKGKTPCFGDPQSTSGYVVPMIFLKNAGLTEADIPAPVFTGGHTQTVQALYNGGTCDYGATFVDARSNIAKTSPDVNDKVVVVYQTQPIIPNDNMSYAPDMPADLRGRITLAMLRLSTTPVGKQALKDLYQISGITLVDDTAYDKFRSYLTASGIDISQYVK
jgi:phosphonate transport system substrate-binding protein